MKTLRWINVALRGIMELGIVLGLGYWGYYTGENMTWKILLGLGAPVLGFGFWGMVDFHQFGKNGEYFRLVQELVITGGVAVLLIIADQLLAGVLMAGLSVIHHALVYLLGDKLLKPGRRKVEPQE